MHLGVHSEINFRLDNEYDPNVIPVDSDLVKRSIAAQMGIEEEWLVFLRGRDVGLVARSVLALRALRLRLKYLNAAGTHVTPLGYGAMKRLINIELSHMALLRQGHDSGSDWILILEDDAGTTNISDAATGIADLLSHRVHDHLPRYVNLSHSFSPQQLGIQDLLSPVLNASWEGKVGRVVYQASKPVTNTVCAVLYRREFLTDLLPALQSIPIDPVLPIDWKLNRALMQMFTAGSVRAGDCWLIEPAPIVQMSMHRGES